VLYVSLSAGHGGMEVGDLVRYDGNKIGLLLDNRFNTAIIYTMDGSRMKLYLPLVERWEKVGKKDAKR